ncbi:SPL family radical SAM protein [Paenibacillus pinistramenti]|uniref:SPL family radical SAM protein n=1 Tax=Paenibacillus pinistramenti TaxID=1768003 RepID=UPI001109DB0C|nr:radical SAM protein [Paenibacillus pinistramenti]
MAADLHYRQPKSLLNKGTGFLAGYTHSLNPYTGCSFACSYCYVRQMPVSLFRGQEWGSWLDVKLGAAELLAKELQRAKKKGKVTIFMSSSTDPYQPVEYKERVTRSLLEVMVSEPPDFLLVQTRSPLVTRDTDLLQQLGDRVRVSMTVETDLDQIRRHFSPYAPPIAARLKALERLEEAGIATQAAIAPVLPGSPEFAYKLAKVTNRVCVDDYFMGDGSGGKRTGRMGLSALYRQLGMEEWFTPTAYLRVYEQMKEVFGDEHVFVSQEGFEP